MPEERNSQGRLKWFDGTAWNTATPCQTQTQSQKAYEGRIQAQQFLEDESKAKLKKQKDILETYFLNIQNYNYYYQMQKKIRVKELLTV